MDIERAHTSVIFGEKIEFARALLEKLEGISREQSSIESARRNYRILEMMKR